jgi:hypothetical protein
MIGVDEISSFDDETREAKLCTNLYPTTRDSLLQQHPWRFSLGQASLARLVDTPLYGYDYAYQLPAGFLRVTLKQSEAIFLFMRTLFTLINRI